ncbi:MAG: exosortase/archaeosortase family protein [Myxococcota bacterium]|nr:exosortase/archaeosortase family protein [Myxococcota bacterium]
MSEASQQTSHRPSLRPTLWEGVLAVALLLAMTPTWIELSKVWQRYDYYSHGFLVPIAALWAATAQRGKLPRLPRERSLVGGLLLGVGLCLNLMGSLAVIVSLQGVSLVLCVAGAVWFARGTAWAKCLAFSISYLIFMVPVPEGWITPLIARLQLFVSATAIPLVNALGIAAEREGNVMWLPDGESLFVAEACSGITSILTLIPLAVFLAWFTQSRLSRRAWLVVAVVPLAMAGNLLRVAITVGVAHYHSIEMATGETLHNLAGIATYVVGCLALLAIGRAMDRFAPLPKARA